MRPVPIASATLVLLLWQAVPAPSQSSAPRPLGIRHEVALPDPASRTFQVTSTFSNVPRPALTLALPAWTPGWYTIERYAKNVLRFTVTDAAGRPVPWQKTTRQAWTIDTRGISTVRVTFQYQADRLGLNQAKITRDWAFFTGTQLFLEPMGFRDRPATLRLLPPPGWQVVSALRPGADSLTFTARNYDELVDAPTELGRFDVLRFQVEGKPHTLAVTPAGTYTPEELQRFPAMAGAIARAEAGVFGVGLPYDRYTYFVFHLAPETTAGGGLEHANAHVDIIGPRRAGQPIEALQGIVAHEFFHLWNVKRLRPAELWPYRYHAEQEVPSLWVSEGFTNYYGELARLRAGLASADEFLQDLAGTIGGYESNDARRFVSMAEASRATWLGYDTPQAYTVSYYPGGQIVGALLDVMLLSDTRGAAGLDSLMRILWRTRYLAGQGFTHQDVVRAASGIARRDYASFFARWVTGTEPPPYDSVFALAGLSYQVEQQQRGMLGFMRGEADSGVGVESVTPDSPAAVAGLRPGDVIESVDGKPFDDAGIPGRAGQSVTLGVRRGTERVTLSATVGSQSTPRSRLVERPEATAAQRLVRERWLRRSP